MCEDERHAEWGKLAADADIEAGKHLPSPAALATIREALDRARERLGSEDAGRHRIPFRRQRWHFGGTALPAASVTREYISRQDGFDVGKQPQTPAANWQLFCTSFIFGYGRSGLGPIRFRRITGRTAPQDLSAVVAEARRRLAQCGPLSAYDYLRGSGSQRTVPYWGPAFFTKLLYFADTSGKTLILDNQIARTVHTMSGMEHLVGRYGRSECWTAWRYGVYLAWMCRVADALEVQPDFLEYALFMEAKQRRPRRRRT